MEYSQGDYLQYLALVVITAQEFMSPHARDLWTKLQADKVRAYCLQGDHNSAARITERLDGFRVRIEDYHQSRREVLLEAGEPILLINYVHYKRQTKTELLLELAEYRLKMGGELS